MSTLTDAERMRVYRRRRARGARVVLIELDGGQIDSLVLGGWLRPSQDEDATAIADALARCLAETLG